MHYRLYQPGDFEQLYAIELACFQPPLRFPRAYMRKLVESSRAATWVAEGEGELAGFSIVDWRHSAEGAIAYIETLEVAATRRKQGIGAELLRRVEDSARAAGADVIWLHVDARNAPAIRLYEAQGFKFQGSEEHFYARQHAALIYSKPLFQAREPSGEL